MYNPEKNSQKQKSLKHFSQHFLSLTLKKFYFFKVTHNRSELQIIHSSCNEQF